MPPLILKDILHFAVDFDPSVAIGPYPFPRDTDSPLPFIKTFTCDEFRTFWHHERNAFQWRNCPEGNSRSFYNEHNPPETLLPTPDPKIAGRPRQYDWSVKHACRHHRPAKALSIKRESVGQGCPVRIRIQKLRGADQINIEYYWRHSHNTGPEAQAHFPLGKSEAEWSKARVSEGHTWKGIKRLLEPSEEQPQSIECDEKIAPPGLFIKYDDVRGVLYCQRMIRCKKDKDIVSSVGLWIEHIKSEGGNGLFLEEGGQFMIAWSTALQLKIMRGSKLVVCMDSTQKSFRLLAPTDNPNLYSSAYLFTILAQDRQVQNEIPIAFMMCNVESRGRIIEWFSWLKSECGLEIEKLVLDCALVKTEAINAIFPGASIYYCLFHVGQLWEKQLSSSFLAEECDKVRPLLNRVRKAESEEKMRQHWEKFKAQYPHAIAFVGYIESVWLNERNLPGWTNFVGEYMDTDGVIERWHKTLRKYHVGRERFSRADFLVYMLLEAVNDSSFSISSK